MDNITKTIRAAVPSPTPTDAPVVEEEEFYSSWSLFLVCLLLIISLWTSYYLQIKKIKTIHETLVSIFAGMFVGLLIDLAPGTMIREMLTFKHTLFFNLLLPPIILNSGYELKQENFFRNFGSILTFAFLGTFISAVGVGVLVYIYSVLGLESLEFTLIECLIFGSTLSATDPVTILAIFNQYKVDPKLYSIIFGESLLNDAVSIVMYETLSRFHGEQVYITSIFHGIGIFLVSFSVSLALGVSFGLGMSLLLKHSSLNLYPSIESCLVALVAYTCYFFSNGLSMSGIVSLLFCGITLKHYAYHTMSRRTQRTTKYIFATLAQLSENFIFIYLGMSLFTSAPTGEKVTSYVKPLFIIITTIAVIFTRYAAVFPLSEAINFFLRHARGQRNEELPHAYQMMLFWAGLRGAVGVALAAGFQGTNAQVLRTTVLVVVVLTVLMFGGTTARMLEVLQIRTGVEDEGASSDEEDEGALPGAGGRSRWLYNNARRSSSGGGGRWGSYAYTDDDPTARRASAAARIGTHYGLSNYNHHTQATSPLNNGAIFSAASSSDSDSDVGEVLPMASTSHTTAAGAPSTIDAPGSSGDAGASSTPVTATAEDGKWFQALDERYLLPLFSNATASRTFHARRARRTASSQHHLRGSRTGSRAGSLSVTPAESDAEDDIGGEVELGAGGGGGGGAGIGGSGGPAMPGGVGLTGRRDSVPIGLGTQQVVDVDMSRQERGLPSPMLRGSLSGSGVSGNGSGSSR